MKCLIRKSISFVFILHFALSLQAQSTCPDGNHPHCIDLGLPSGTKWACCNVGANKPHEIGSYYAWGETKTKSLYIIDNYEHYSHSYQLIQGIGYQIWATQYDAAFVKNHSWQMPSLDQIKELMDKCKYEWTSVNGINGARFTGPSGQSIFLPATGAYLPERHNNLWLSKLKGYGTHGCYWSGTLESPDYAYSLNFELSKPLYLKSDRPFGLTIRPIAREQTLSECPDVNHPHLIDLGLPSGTKWACCNVGASKPESYGGYFAWGETAEKNIYDYDNYIYDSYHEEISSTIYDVAHVKWGGSWQLPTLAQFKELKDKCRYEWTSVNGVEGARFIGPSGRSIFLPSAGWKDSEHYFSNIEGAVGYYWLANQSNISQFNATLFGIKRLCPYQEDNSRTHGYTVRSVCDNNSLSKRTIPIDTFIVNGVSFTMIKVESGTFIMGNKYWKNNEYPTPEHEVTLSSFKIGESEVTQALWAAVMGKKTHLVNPNHPMEWVSWYDCQQFIKKLNKLTGKNFRLPTEAEWEYAAKKSIGITEKSKNVMEWCSDLYGDYPTTKQTNPIGALSGKTRVVRGTRGEDWIFNRLDGFPNYKGNYLGLRLAIDN